jgi:hypothetical protein
VLWPQTWLLASITGLGTRIHERFAGLGGMDLELPDRSERPRAAEFDA